MRRNGSIELNTGIGYNPELYKLRVLFCLHVFLLITLIVMPQYFGIHIGWDITCTRFANMLIIFYALMNPTMISVFIKTSIKCVSLIPLMLYLIVTGYTMVLRVDINAFMNPFLEILTFFMMLLGIRYVIGCKRAIKIIIGCSYFLSAYGLVEFAAGRSFYVKFLRTLPAAIGTQYRSGYYRIMGPCGHSIGYGLLLIILIAVACIDLTDYSIYMFKRPILIAMLAANVLFTGSRSSQGMMILELLLIFLITPKGKKEKTLFYMFAFVLAGAFFLIVAHDTKIGNYFMLQITTLMDQVLGTSFSANFGAQVQRLEDSEEYRKFLPYIFKLDWLNPLVGRGVKRSFASIVYNSKGEYAFIESVDNFYIVQYIKFAYPGMISYILFILSTGFYMLYESFRAKNGALKVLTIAFFCYFINLWFVDALQTQKFIYTITALFFAIVYTEKESILVKGGSDTKE